LSRALAILALVLAPLVARAQVVAECDARALAGNIVEPWEENSRSFANGNVRLAVLDTIEPAAAAFNILVLSPPFGMMGERQCRIVSLDSGLGFFSATLRGMRAGYDPTIGLNFAIDVQLFNPQTGLGSPAVLRLTLNQASGEIGAVVE
jgi:hypothetical protein